jgi:hypothetical protein
VEARLSLFTNLRAEFAQLSEHTAAAAFSVQYTEQELYKLHVQAYVNLYRPLVQPVEPITNRFAPSRYTGETFDPLLMKPSTDSRQSIPGHGDFTPKVCCP